MHTKNVTSFHTSMYKFTHGCSKLLPDSVQHKLKQSPGKEMGHHYFWKICEEVTNLPAAGIHGGKRNL